MPQKQPPASTAVSSPLPGAEASAAGGGMVTADSASAANGLKARAVAKSRVEGRIMVFVPDVYPLTYRGEFGLWLHTNGTRLRDPAKWSGVRRHPGGIIICPPRSS